MCKCSNAFSRVLLIGRGLNLRGKGKRKEVKEKIKEVITMFGFEGMAFIMVCEIRRRTKFFDSFAKQKYFPR